MRAESWQRAGERHRQQRDCAMAQIIDRPAKPAFARVGMRVRPSTDRRGDCRQDDRDRSAKADKDGNEGRDYDGHTYRWASLKWARRGLADQRSAREEASVSCGRLGSLSRQCNRSQLVSAHLCIYLKTLLGPRSASEAKFGRNQRR